MGTAVYIIIIDDGHYYTVSIEGYDIDSIEWPDRIIDVENKRVYFDQEWFPIAPYENGI